MIAMVSHGSKDLMVCHKVQWFVMGSIFEMVCHG